MKNGKLNLSKLKVKSFLTEFDKSKELTVKGGAPLSAFSECEYGPCASQSACHSWREC